MYLISNKAMLIEKFRNTINDIVSENNEKIALINTNRDKIESMICSIKNFTDEISEELEKEELNDELNKFLRKLPVTKDTDELLKTTKFVIYEYDDEEYSSSGGNLQQEELNIQVETLFGDIQIYARYVDYNINTFEIEIYDQTAYFSWPVNELALKKYIKNFEFNFNKFCENHENGETIDQQTYVNLLKIAFYVIDLFGNIMEMSDNVIEILKEKINEGINLYEDKTKTKKTKKKE
jgi:hypothetical protein